MQNLKPETVQQTFSASLFAFLSGVFSCFAVSAVPDAGDARPGIAII